MSRRLRLHTAVAAVGAVLVSLPLASGSVAAAQPGNNSSVSWPIGTGSASVDPAAGYDVLFVRHGHSTYPQPEEELSPLGIEQAAALAESLEGAPVNAVHTSMMLRAFQTGDDVASDHDVPVLADENLREIAFKAPADLPPAEQAAYYSNIVKLWISGEERDNDFGGEGYRAVEARWNTWWEGFLRQHRNDHGTAVVVAHGGIYGVMLPATCSNEITADFAVSHPLDNTGIVKARLHPDGTLTCSEWNGVPVPSAS
ncbi:histidine phosphatase family protein [Rhodococcus sp. PAM 2766]|uniref:Histidine phosphatase family protein n=1 Tax=Rhodococcus parequi TaxID=3137122 RepID=A0ABW9FC98_9NOCA